MTINCKGQLIDLSSPRVMGILNITPDSFYDGGRYKNESQLLSQVERMLEEGATFIDLGAYSSRPNADDVSEDLELARILPVVETIIQNFPECLISIDTFRSRIASECVARGAAMINDISAGILDSNMLPTIAELHIPYIMMHMKGTPQTMQSLAEYEHITKEVLFYFSERMAAARALGIVDLIIDPGFGFAKTTDQNFELLKHLQHFKFLELPLLVGVSRKSMIYKTLATDAENALNGSTVLHTYSLLNGANILRAHDVKQAMECINLLQKLN